MVRLCVVSIRVFSARQFDGVLLSRYSITGAILCAVIVEGVSIPRLIRCSQISADRLPVDDTSTSELRYRHTLTSWPFSGKASSGLDVEVLDA